MLSSVKIKIFIRQINQFYYSHFLFFKKKIISNLYCILISNKISKENLTNML